MQFFGQTHGSAPTIRMNTFFRADMQVCQYDWDKNVFFGQTHGSAPTIGMNTFFRADMQVCQYDWDTPVGANLRVRP